MHGHHNTPGNTILPRNEEKGFKLLFLVFFIVDFGNVNFTVFSDDVINQAHCQCFFGIKVMKDKCWLHIQMLCKLGYGNIFKSFFFCDLVKPIIISFCLFSFKLFLPMP